MTTSRTRAAPVGDADHALGPGDAPVTLIEYGDYECEHCALAEPALRALLAEAGGRLRFVFRHFPVASLHGRAEQAAEAAEAAAAQGRFWEMHRCLMEQAPQLDTEHLMLYAAQVGLDVEAFAMAMIERTYAGLVRESLLEGIRGGVSGTPTFFLNGAHCEGCWAPETLTERVRRAVAALSG